MCTVKYEVCVMKSVEREDLHVEKKKKKCSSPMLDCRTEPHMFADFRPKNFCFDNFKYIHIYLSYTWLITSVFGNIYGSGTGNYEAVGTII